MTDVRVTGASLSAYLSPSGVNSRLTGAAISAYITPAASVVDSQITGTALQVYYSPAVGTTYLRRPLPLALLSR